MPCIASLLRASLCRLSAHSAAAPQPQQQPSGYVRPSLRRGQAVHCQAAGSTLSSKSQQSAQSGAAPVKILLITVCQPGSATTRMSTAGVQVEREEVPHYAEGSEYLRSLGFRNVSEISRVLDIAMNPNSLYLQGRHKRRSVNSSVRIK